MSESINDSARQADSRPGTIARPAMAILLAGALVFAGCTQTSPWLTAQEAFPVALKQALAHDKNAVLVAISSNDSPKDGLAMGWNFEFESQDDGGRAAPFWVFVSSSKAILDSPSGNSRPASPPIAGFAIDSPDAVERAVGSLAGFRAALEANNGRMTMNLKPGTAWGCDNPFWSYQSDPVWKLDASTIPTIGAPVSPSVAYVDAVKGTILAPPKLPAIERHPPGFILTAANPSANDTFDPNESCGENIVWSLWTPATPGTITYVLSDGAQTVTEKSDIGPPFGIVRLSYVVHAQGRPWTATVNLDSGVIGNFTMAWQALPPDA